MLRVWVTLEQTSQIALTSDLPRRVDLRAEEYSPSWATLRKFFDRWMRAVALSLNLYSLDFMVVNHLAYNSIKCLAMPAIVPLTAVKVRLPNRWIPNSKVVSFIN